MPARPLLRIHFVICALLVVMKNLFSIAHFFYIQDFVILQHSLVVENLPPDTLWQPKNVLAPHVEEGSCGNETQGNGRRTKYSAH